MVEEGRVPYHEHDDSDIREALALALEHLADSEESDRKERRLTRWLQTGAYVLIVAVGVLTLAQIGRTSDQLCQGATENRAALRSVVAGVSDLGASLILGDSAPSDYIDPQQAAALARVEDFKKKQLKTLELPICER